MKRFKSIYTVLILGLASGAAFAKDDALKGPIIKSVSVDQDAGMLFITGEDFIVDSEVFVFLADIPLVTELALPNLVQASFENVTPGEYRLAINMKGGKVIATFDLTIGPSGPRFADIYTRSTPAPPVVGSFLGTTVRCDEGDVATGGGVSCPTTGSCSSGSNGPFISIAGPVLDADGKPVGFEFAMSNLEIGSPIRRELYVICADISP